MVKRVFAMVLGLTLLGGFAVAETLVLRVDTDGFADFDATAPTVVGGSAFYVSGDICAELTLLDPCTPIGKFHCWGWLVGPDQTLGLVSQEFDLFERGKIQVQGVEDEGRRAVIGGTRNFRRVRGQVKGFDFSEFGTGAGEFIATFKLSGSVEP
jgi:hypothetical protein